MISSYSASLPRPSFTFIQNEDDSDKAIKELEAVTTISVDTETTGLNPLEEKVLLVQVATQEMSYIFDTGKVDIQKLSGVLENKSIVKIIQNAKFDYKMMAANYGIKMNNMFCTMLAERILTTGIIPRPKSSLAALTNKYLGITMVKEIRKGFISKKYGEAEFTDEELVYAANDTVVLFDIFKSQLTELIDVSLLETALLEFEVLPYIGDMELSGCLLDKDTWRTTIENISYDKKLLADKILKAFDGAVPQNDLFGLPSINLASHPQVMKALRSSGVVMPTGAPIQDTNEATLVACKDKFPICGKLLDYRGLEKLSTSYGESFLSKISPVTGRLHANFNQLRADTGRMSSSSPNLQQVPSFYPPDGFDTWKLLPKHRATYFHKENNKTKQVVYSDLRKCFIPVPGKKLVTADYSQQELRILAAASQDPTFISAYHNNEDIHTKTAAMIYGVSLDNVEVKQRKAAKTLNFALIYGAGAWKIAIELGVEEQEAQELIDSYFKVYRGIKGFMKKRADFAVRSGFSTTVSGRRRYYKIPTPLEVTYKKDLGRIRRQAPNHYVQGSGADVTKRAIIYVNDFIRASKKDIKMLMVVHDEIVLEAYEKDAAFVAKGLEEAMIKGFSHYFPDVPMVVDAVIADYWTK